MMQWGRIIHIVMYEGSMTVLFKYERIKSVGHSFKSNVTPGRCFPNLRFPTLKHQPRRERTSTKCSTILCEKSGKPKIQQQKF